MITQSIMARMATITEARKATGLTVSFKSAGDTEWQSASFATAARAEHFKARVIHQGGEVRA